MLELRMLRLADHQAAVRATIEKEQEEIQGMSDRNYRKFARNCLRQRIEIIKQVSMQLDSIGNTVHLAAVWVALTDACLQTAC